MALEGLVDQLNPVAPKCHRSMVAPDHPEAQLDLADPRIDYNHAAPEDQPTN